MFHDAELKRTTQENLAAMGTDAVAYMRHMTGAEITEAFPYTPKLEKSEKYWALFGADGSPLMLASTQSDITSSAFFNNLKTVLPN